MATRLGEELRPNQRLVFGCGLFNTSLKAPANLRTNGFDKSCDVEPLLK